MEIGIVFLFILISLGIIFGETKIGTKFTKWGLKRLMNINIDDYKN